MPKSVEQRLRDYLKKKYGNPRNIFIREETTDGIQVPDVQKGGKAKQVSMEKLVYRQRDNNM